MKWQLDIDGSVQDFATNKTDSKNLTPSSPGAKITITAVFTRNVDIVVDVVGTKANDLEIVVYDENNKELFTKSGNFQLETEQNYKIRVLSSFTAKSGRAQFIRTSWNETVKDTRAYPILTKFDSWLFGSTVGHTHRSEVA